LIWTVAHLLRSYGRNFRDSLQQKLGNGSKALMGLVILVSLALMIFGYRTADTNILWIAPGWMVYVNNVLMVLAVYIYFTTATKPDTAFLFASLKHPQLTGFKIWAVAHLLVNGELKSLVLFGGLLIWAVLQVVASKRSESLVDRAVAPIASPWVHLALVTGMLVLIVFVHSWLGKSPFM